MKVNFSPALFCVITLVSCQSAHLVPVSYSVENPGETISFVKDEIAEIYLEHIPDESKQLVFDLDVWNTGNEYMVVKPQNMMIFGSPVPFPTPSNTDLNVYQETVSISGVTGKRASSQEEVNAFFRRRIRSQQAAQIALVLAGVALAVNDAVQDSKDYNKEFWTKQDSRRSAARDVATFAGFLTVDILSQAFEHETVQVREDLAYLPQEYLNEEMLYPDGHTRGRVFFRYSADYDYYRIILPVEGVHYIFDFRRPEPAERKFLKRIHE